MHRGSVLVAGLLASAIGACSGAPPDDAPDYEVAPSASTPTPEKPVVQPGVDAATDAGPEAGTAKRYRGALARTDKFAFGGGTFCNYEMVFEDVTFELSMLDGKVSAATARNVAVETAIKCQYAPSPPAVLDFTLQNATAIATGTRVGFNGAEKNSPKTELVVELAAQAGGYEAKATWRRVDQKGPLNWTVTATVLLTEN